MTKKSILQSIKFSRSTFLVLSGFSGAGKTTIRNEIIRAIPNAQFSLSITTRKQRDYEQNGVDYSFVSLETFKNMIGNNGFLEYEAVHRDYYGTPLKPVLEAQKKPGLLIFDVDVHGGLSIKKVFPKAILVFLQPPDLDELKKRLFNRRTEGLTLINHRLRRIPIERKLSKKYDHIITNDRIKNAVEKIGKIILDYQKK